MISKLTASRCRLLILDLLVREGEASGGRLEEELDCGRSTVRRNLKILLDDGWVEKDGTYTVPRMRRILLQPLLKAARLFEVYEEHEEFWTGHEIPGLPADILWDLEMLAGADLVRGETAEPLMPLRVAGERMLESSRMRILSPTFLEQYVDVYREAHERGIDVELVLTREGLRQAKELPEVTDVWEEKLAKEGLELFHVEEMEPMLFVGDDFVALSLPHTGGESVDLSAMLLATGPEAVEWGRRLFDHYRSRARRVTDIHITPE